MWGSVCETKCGTVRVTPLMLWGGASDTRCGGRSGGDGGIVGHDVAIVVVGDQIGFSFHDDQALESAQVTKPLSLHS